MISSSDQPRRVEKDPKLKLEFPKEEENLTKPIEPAQVVSVIGDEIFEEDASLMVKGKKKKATKKEEPKAIPQEILDMKNVQINPFTMEKINSLLASLRPSLDSYPNYHNYGSQKAPTCDFFKQKTKQDKVKKGVTQKFKIGEIL